MERDARHFAGVALRIATNLDALMREQDEGLGLSCLVEKSGVPARRAGADPRILGRESIPLPALPVFGCLRRRPPKGRPMRPPCARRGVASRRSWAGTARSSRPIATTAETGHPLRILLRAPPRGPPTSA